MDLQLQGKTAIVTGATAGIGLAIARTLAREGVAVTVTGRHCDKLEVGAFTPPDMVHYGVSKSAQLAVSRGMAELTKGTGVTVNSVLPAATRSDGIVEYLRQTAPRPGMSDAEIEAHFFQTYRPSSLIARMIEADEIAAMVALLASPLGAASNGAAVRVEGGSFRSIL
ncbi:SDR family NAD(P)-dependent oxidoreductase [Cupriavidus gilardii]|uniref:SDR family NAD(P)-dependent oxidoreductase n=1 Tax=Cupriavidus gilardii TaxID=82541 RepID=UPI0015801AF0|nr:SDR family NAD(P)-dependent oxidoreductase [Cupriavidus gilardii]MCT9070290.1 SDR family oxidoreductase [Cupriavidus gilardii]QKS61307.1 SDR family oxidoreductase [Cupriavidus gilardii]